MRMNKSLSIFTAMAVMLLLILVLPGSTLAVGTCHSSKGCPCTKEQEKQGMKTVGGNCVDCARNAKELEELEKKRMALETERDKLREQVHENRSKLNGYWSRVQDEVPHFSDAVRGYIDLPGRVLAIEQDIQIRSSSRGPRELRASLKAAYRDLSGMAELLKPARQAVGGTLLRDLVESIRYQGQLEDAQQRLRDIRMEIDDLNNQIEEKRKVQEKCSGKRKGQSGRNLLEVPAVYVTRVEPPLRFVASADSATTPTETPCSSSAGKLSRCEEARQVLTDIQSFDLPETSVAFGDARLILEPFDRDNADKIADQEVLQRAKQTDPALKKLAGLLDRLVTRSNRVLALLKGGAS